MVPTAAEDFIARHAVAIEHVTGKSPAWCVRSRTSVHTVHAAFNYAEAQPCPTLPLPYPAPAPALPHRTTRTPLYIRHAYAGLPRTGGESTLALYSCILFAHCGPRISRHRSRGGDGSDAQHCWRSGGRQVRGGQPGAPVLVHVAQAARAAARPPGHRRQDRALVRKGRPLCHRVLVGCGCLVERQSSAATVVANRCVRHWSGKAFASFLLVCFLFVCFSFARFVGFFVWSSCSPPRGVGV